MLEGQFGDVSPRGGNAVRGRPVARVARPPASFADHLIDFGLLRPADLERVGETVRRTGATSLEIIHGEGLVADGPLYEALAVFHDLPFLAADEGWLTVEVEPVELESCLKHMWVRLRDGRGRTFVLAAPRDPSARLLRHLGVPGAAGHRVIDGIAPPPVLRALIDRAASQAFTEKAVWDLARNAPGFSAHRRLVPWQAATLASFAVAFAIGFWVLPEVAVVAAGAIFGVTFLAVAALRLVLLIAAFGRRRPVPPLPGRQADAALPVYSVLVPLYREAAIVHQTVEALLGLDYPRARLDIKLILEEDDPETLAALRKINLPGCFEVVIVPPSLPRTKPKALNYALPRARGDLVAVFDAEDIPRPDQLRRAAAAFAASPDRLACLQARLGIYNSRQNWLTRQFTVEYATLFEAVIPALDRLGLPLMLGGTSNHFRAPALKAAGGWDAFNVTEDADLGIRLARLGYRCGWLESITLEEATASPWDWLQQRQRWLRGWIQTYFVHMQNPAALFADLGPWRFLSFQAMVGGISLAALAYPVFLVQFALAIWDGTLFLPPGRILADGLLVVNGLNLLFGYCIVVELAVIGLYRAGRPGLMWQLPLVPLYWLLVSIAGYGAAWRFLTRPFEWEKTRHRARPEARRPTA